MLVSRANLRERGIPVEILINNAGHGLQGTFLAKGCCRY
jgi:short-subunit dehydrogenase